MYKYFSYDKAVAKKIKNLKVNKRLSEEQLEDIHDRIKEHVDCARSELHHAIMEVMQVIDVSTLEKEAIEKNVEILIQRPDICAHKLFTFARDVIGKI
jgi:predicted transcriptional regulator